MNNKKPSFAHSLSLQEGTRASASEAGEITRYRITAMLSQSVFCSRNWLSDLAFTAAVCDGIGT